MRRSYISPEFDHKEVYGTYNMVEESNFFGAKMLEIEDSLLINNQNIIYYQMPNGEQLDLSVENTLQPYVYSSADDKNINHQLIIDETQTSYSKENLTTWILEIKLKNIISNYIFGELKRWRTFEGIRTNMTSDNDVNIALKNYVSYNVVDRYKLSRIDLYVQYKDLRNQNILRYKNSWNPEIANNPQNKTTKFQSDTYSDGSYTKLTFNQEMPSSLYSFDYFFNLYFEKL
jgi:hypothetical protein